MSTITGNGSAGLGLLASGAEHYGAGRLAFSAQGSGYQAAVGTGHAALALNAVSSQTGVVGIGSAAIGLGAFGEAGVSVGGRGSARLRLKATNDGGFVGVGGDGKAVLYISTAVNLKPGPLGVDSPNLPLGYVPVSGDGSASIRMSVSGVAALQAVYEAFLLHTKTRGHGRYDNFPFDSLFILDGVCYGCSCDGIHRLDGDDDNGVPIGAIIESGVLTFNKPEQKQVSDVYLQLRAFGDMELDVTCVEQQKRTGYIVENNGSEGLQRRRRKLAKGIQGTSWQFALKNVNGSDFDLHQIEFDIDVLTRST